jgi:hypothetical protein
MVCVIPQNKNKNKIIYIYIYIMDVLDVYSFNIYNTYIFLIFCQIIAYIDSYTTCILPWILHIYSHIFYIY